MLIFDKKTSEKMEECRMLEESIRKSTIVLDNSKKVESFSHHKNNNFTEEIVPFSL
jgi:hypothetical protein